MDREQLQNVFQQKIHNELKIFRCQILQEPKEMILESAYKVVCMTQIYEAFLQHSYQMSIEELKKYIQVWGLLEYVFSEWLKNPDTQEHSLWSFVTTING